MTRALPPALSLPAVTITRRVVLPVVLALSTLSAAVPAQSTAAASPLQGLGVRLADVTRAYGAGFRLGFAMPISRKLFQSTAINVAGVKTSMAGFAAGYGATYIRISSMTHGNGAYSVSSTIGQYTSAATPRRNMDQVLAHLDVLTREAATYATEVKTSSLTGVGDQAILETSRLKQGRRSYTALILLRRGRYTATLVVLSGGPSQAGAAIALAKTVDSRLQHAP